MDNKNKIVVKSYTGTEASATQQFKVDAKRLAEKGYFPSTQSWAPGAYGCGSFILALVLCLIIVGFIVFVYMLLVKPPGTLTVTFELKADPLDALRACVFCAELIQRKAKLCRFCNNPVARQYVENPDANAQIHQIMTLTAQGKTPGEVAAAFASADVLNLTTKLQWRTDEIQAILKSFNSDQ